MLIADRGWVCPGTSTASEALLWARLLARSGTVAENVRQIAAFSFSVVLACVLSPLCAAQNGKVETIGPLTDTSVSEAAADSGLEGLSRGARRGDASLRDLDPQGRARADEK